MLKQASVMVLELCQIDKESARVQTRELGFLNTVAKMAVPIPCVIFVRSRQQIEAATSWHERLRAVVRTVIYCGESAEDQRELLRIFPKLTGDDVLCDGEHTPASLAGHVKLLGEQFEQRTAVRAPYAAN